MVKALSPRMVDVLTWVQDHGPASNLRVYEELQGEGKGRGGTVRATLKALQRRGLVEFHDGVWAATRRPQ
jgi:hypothetical protein